jgi:hypothetical protein
MVGAEKEDKMEQPQQQVPLVDQGNPFLGNSQATIAMGVDHDNQRVIFTVRSGGATMTLMLQPEMVDFITNTLAEKKAELGTGLLIPAGLVDLAALGRHAKMTEQLRNGH